MLKRLVIGLVLSAWVWSGAEAKGLFARTGLAVSSLTLTDMPAGGRVFQRSPGATSGPISFACTYSPAAAAVNLQAQVRLMDGTIAVPWFSVTTTASAGVCSGAGGAVPQGPDIAQAGYKIEIRDSFSGVTASGSNAFWMGINAIAMGQSNMVAGFFDASATPPTPVNGTKTYFDGSGYSDPGTSNGVRNFMNDFRNATGIPIAVGYAAWSATSLKQQLTNTPPCDLCGGRSFLQYINDVVVGMGGDIEVMLHQGGEGETVDGRVDEMAAYTSNLALLKSTTLSYTNRGRTATQFPLVIGSLAWTDYPSATWNLQQWANVSSQQSAIGTTIPGGFFSHSARDLPLGDNLHYSSTGAIQVGRRYARGLQVALGLSSTKPAWFATAATRVSDTSYNITLAHSMGTDWTPSSGVVGWQWSTNGSTWTDVPATSRTNATTLNLTTTTTSGQTAYFRYQYGTIQYTSAPILDNSALNSPLNFTPANLVAIGPGGLPSPVWQGQAIYNANVFAVPHTLVVPFISPLPVASRLLVSVEGPNNPIVGVTFTCDVGGALTATAVGSRADSGVTATQVYGMDAPAGCGVLTLAATYSSTTYAGTMTTIFAIPSSALSSTTATTASITGSVSASGNVATSAGGFMVAFININNVADGTCCTLAITGDASSWVQNSAAWQPLHWSWSAPNVATDASNAFTLTVTGSTQPFAAVIVGMR